jgi:hypothetical protein
MKNMKLISRTVIALAAIIMMTTPVIAGDNGNGQGRGGRTGEDCSRGHNGDDLASIIQVENLQLLLARRGNDCDHEHVNEKAGNDNGNGHADEGEVG